MCTDENFHTKDKEPYHKEGSYFNNFVGESDILQPLYASYIPGIPSQMMNNPEHLTHAPSTSNEQKGIKYDRKLDYLFTNTAEGWMAGSASTHQNLWPLSDHMPVSAILNLTED